MNIKKEVAEKMTAMLKREIDHVNGLININKMKIKRLAEEQASLKRQRKPLTDLLNEWEKNYERR